jgi:hypothetical protein
MKSDFLRIIFDIIVLIVLALLIFIIIMAIIGLAYGKELAYIGYLNSIANDINGGGSGQVFINNYDYNYVFVLTNNNGWYLQLYRCLPPSYYTIGLLSVTIAYWNVSTTDNGETFIFAPALAFCKLVKQRSLSSSINQINISIQGLNDNAGLLALTSNSNLEDDSNFQITIPLTTSSSPSSSLVIINDTLITCNGNGCTFNSSSTGENGNISCAPSSSINSNNNNLQFNPSNCVELWGFPWNSQVQLNLEAALATEALNSIFPVNFRLLYFAGSLPPTAIYIYINSNTTSGTADINIYIGETVPSSSS